MKTPQTFADCLRDEAKLLREIAARLEAMLPHLRTTREQMFVSFAERHVSNAALYCDDAVKEMER